MSPTVSVLVPTYNRPDTLPMTIAAMMRQSFDDWELIVGDDASTEPIGDVVARFKDPRIKFSPNAKNLGIYANWNRLIGEATGEYVAIFHDHDTYLPTILQRSVDLLVSNPNIAFVHSAVLMVGKSGLPLAVDIRPFAEVTNGNEFRYGLARSLHSSVMAATAVVRRSAYDKVGLFEPERFGLGCDKDMWFRLAGTGDVGYVAQPQAYITAREKGEPTSDWSWSNEEAHCRMCVDECLALSDSEGAHLARIDFSKKLLALYARSLMLESPQVQVEGARLFPKYWGVVLGPVLAGVLRLPPTVAVMRRFFLPAHRERVDAALEEHRREAEGWSASVMAERSKISTLAAHYAEQPDV